MNVNSSNNLLKLLMEGSQYQGLSGRMKMAKPYFSQRRDALDLSATGQELSKPISKVSAEEAQKNRDFIDTWGGAVSYSDYDKFFDLHDKSGKIVHRIHASQVSRKSDPSKVSDLEVKDNQLNMKWGHYYNYTDSDGYKMTFSAAGGLSRGSVVDRMLGIIETTEAENNSKACKTQELLETLMYYSTPIAAYMFSSSEEVKNLLLDLGFKPGKIQIGIEGSTKSTYFFSHDGELHAEYESEARIGAINHRNHLEYGAPEGSVWRIDGKEYEMDENGYFHIPSGIMCVPGEMQLVDKDGNEVELFHPK